MLEGMGGIFEIIIKNKFLGKFMLGGSLSYYMFWILGY